MDFKMAMDSIKRKWVTATQERLHKDFEVMKAHYASLPPDIKRENRH